MRQFKTIRNVDITNRVGLTLVELLVVIGVIGLLVGLLLPAVQAMRESARKTQCQNQLRQMGLAVLNFESQHRQLPSNGWGYRWIADPNRGVGPKQPGGWIYQIAPFAELTLPSANPLDAVQAHRARTEISRTPFPMMRCPSRPGGQFSIASLAARPVNATFFAEVPKTDYAANEGDFITDTDAGPDSLQEGDSRNYDWTPTDKATGVIFLRSTVRISDIVDGTSHVYLCGEKYVSAEHYYDGQDLGYDQSLFSGVDLDLNRWSIDPPLADGDVSEVRRFGSNHHEGAYLAMCDGSVRLAGFTIDRQVHRSLGNRQDGNMAME